MTEIIKTIEDMEKLYYSRAGQQFLNPDDLLSPFITKDAPVLTTTTGVYNAVYGAQAWVQLNMEANTLGYLPKFPWKKSGWRVITARTASLPYGGRAETATLPATVKPTFAEVSTKPKLVAVTFEVGEIQEYLATQGGDDAFAAMSDMRTYMAVEHKEDMNAQLNTQGGTLASNNNESVDRVAANYTELSNKESDQSTAFTANDLDIYSQDRDAAASWADGYVNQTATSGTMRSLTDSLLNSLLQNTLANGANPNGQLIQTGYDTWSAINQLYDAQVRYNVIGKQNIQPGVNGIQTQEGIGVGIQVATLFNKSVIQSKDTVAETGGISRVYMLDTSNPEGFELPRLCMRVAKPTQYFEAGINQGNPFSVNKFSTKGMYRTMDELICTFFKVQGKIRDLNG
jgi:hypothetical protein